VRGLDLPTLLLKFSPMIWEAAVCGGGRYDRLVTELGGPDTARLGNWFRALNITAATTIVPLH